MFCACVRPNWRICNSRGTFIIVVIIVACSKMNAGGFYGPRSRDHFSTSAIPHSTYGRYEIPDQCYYDTNEHSQQQWAQNSGDVAVNQKLDRMLSLMEKQRDEASDMKSEIVELKTKLQEVQAIAEDANKQKTSQQSVKVPRELSVST